MDKIPGTDENWENGTLGCSIKHARVAPPEVSKEMDDILGIETINLRLPKKLVDDYKKFARVNSNSGNVGNINFKTLMKTAIQHFYDHNL